MSYLCVTSRCNMACAHCCQSCKPGKGIDMPMDVFFKALDRVQDSQITIGGGEPTLHPNFLEILINCMAHKWLEMPVLVVTNGTVKHHALLLARLAKHGSIAAELSYNDGYHDAFSYMVDGEVVEAFRPSRKEYVFASDYNRRGSVDRDLQGYRSVKIISKRGRGANITGAENTCACGATFFAPDGSIKPCGCLDAPVIGHVNDMEGGVCLPEDFEYGGCWKSKRNRPLFVKSKKVGAA